MVQPGLIVATSRRTVTYRLTELALKHRKPYSVWPRWLGTFERQPSPGAQMVYAVILSRHCLLDRLESPSPTVGRKPAGRSAKPQKPREIR